MHGPCRLVHGGQTVQWLQRTQGGERLQDMSAPAGLHVVYEDADLACVAKPQGMPVAVSISPPFFKHLCCHRHALRSITISMTI